MSHHATSRQSHLTLLVTHNQTATPSVSRDAPLPLKSHPTHAHLQQVTRAGGRGVVGGCGGLPKKHELRKNRAERERGEKPAATETINPTLGREKERDTGGRRERKMDREKEREGCARNV